MNLSFAFARELDHRDEECKRNNRQTAHDTFVKECFRQPSLTELPVYPEPYRKDLDSKFTQGAPSARRSSMSLDVYDILNETEEDNNTLQTYFNEYVVPLADEFVPKKKVVKSNEDKKNLQQTRKNGQKDNKDKKKAFKKVRSDEFEVADLDSLVEKRHSGK